MTQAEKIAALLALHDEAGKNDDMVYEVWEDGEITLTKGGELYGQRNLHTIEYGNPDKALPIESLPRRQYNHARIIVRDRETAEKARAIILA